MKSWVRLKYFVNDCSLVDFHSLYQLLYSQVYRNGLELWITNIKIYIDKWRRIKQKFAKCLLVETYEWHKESFTHWFNQKMPDAVC